MLIIKLDAQAIQSDRLAMLHHEGDLLLQAPAATNSRKSPALEVILHPPPDRTTRPNGASGLKEPGERQERDLQQFKNLQRELGELLADHDLHIGIPQGEPLLVNFQGARVRLDSHGSAVEQLLVLTSAVATSAAGGLLLIEEPENHLHPTLQRRLLSYLHSKSRNQYILATHSAHVLDDDRGALVSVRRVGGRTQLRRAAAPGEVAAISHGLGMRPSDLVQANSVVWVEGPSDRLYLRSWIQELAPELTEGVHYALMFYGGSLAAHLTADEDAYEDLVRLPQLNRHFGMVMDSDRIPGRRIAPYKVAFRKGLEASCLGFPLWVTEGYTVENYLDPDRLGEALASLPGKLRLQWNGTLDSDPFGGLTMGSGRSGKVALAQSYLSLRDEGSLFRADTDAQTKTEEMIAMIRRANELPAS